MRHPATAFLLVLLFAMPAPAEQVVDDFESYDDGQIVGPAAQSTPWRRFGNATLDNVVATAHPHKVIEGRMSGQYGVGWPARFGSARYSYAAPTDLSAFTAIAIDLRSSIKDSQTTVRLGFDDGTTSFLAKRSLPLSDAAKPFVQRLVADEFERVDGQGSFEATLAAVKSIGFNVYNPRPESDEKLSEVILFDSLRLLESGDETPPQP